MVHFTHRRDATQGHVRNFVARAQAELCSSVPRGGTDEARLDKTNRKDNRMLVAHTRRIDHEVAPFNMFASLLAGAAGLRAQAQANLSIRVVWRCEWALQVAHRTAGSDSQDEGLATTLGQCGAGQLAGEAFVPSHVVLPRRPIFKHRARSSAQEPRRFGVKLFARRNTMPPRSVLRGKGFIVFYRSGRFFLAEHVVCLARSSHVSSSFNMLRVLMRRRSVDHHFGRCAAFFFFCDGQPAS
jgi:hypothetical protein